MKFPLYVNQFLDDVGNGTGSVDMNADFSSHPTEFRLVAPPRYEIRVTSMMLEVRSPNLDPSGYGDRSTGLNNGIRIWAAQRSAPSVYTTFFELGDSLHPQAIRSMPEWARVGGVVHEQTAQIGADVAQFMTLDFVKLLGVPIVLSGNKEGKLVFRVADQFSPNSAVNLTTHRVLVYGQRFTNTTTMEGVAGN